jgi:cysteine desulfurase/selenocysteine lyase
VSRAAHGGGRETFFGLGRNQFPQLSRAVEGRKRLVYLDSACTALKLRAPADKMRDFALEWGGCSGGRSMHSLARRSEEAVAETRSAAASFVGAVSPGEIVFTSGTTEAINLVARGLPLPEGRTEIIVSDLEHNSAYLPFYERAERDGLKLRIAKTENGRLDLKALGRLLSRKTALVCLPHSSNVFGGVLPLDEVCDLAHDAGALVFVDDAQFVQSHREDVQESGVDFAAFSAHKLGGPFGVGVLYGKEHLLNTISPHKPGGGTVAGLSKSRGVWRPNYLDSPQRFEGGIQNYTGIVGLGETIRLHERVDREALRTHIEALVRKTVRGLSELRWVRVLGGEDHLAEGSLVSFHVEDDRFSASDLSIFLDQDLPKHAVAVRVGEHCANVIHGRLSLEETVRISFFAYNTVEDVDLFLDALCEYYGACVGRKVSRRKKR